MGWFKRVFSSEDTDLDRLATLSRRVDDLESKARTMGLEWQDVLDRLERLAGRLAKRAERAALLPKTGDEPADVHEPSQPAAVDIVALRRSRGGGPFRR